MLSLNHPITRSINIYRAPAMGKAGNGGRGAAEAGSDAWEQLTQW